MTKSFDQKIFLILFTLTIFIAFSTSKTIACDCSTPPIKESIENSNAIFSGEVIDFVYRKGIPNYFVDDLAKETSKQVDYETLVVKVRVIEWWKGNLPTEVYILTNRLRFADGYSLRDSCDINFLKGEKYLIFAAKSNAQEENAYRTEKCRRTQNLSTANKELEILGEGKSQ